MYFFLVFIFMTRVFEGKKKGKYYCYAFLLIMPRHLPLLNHNRCKKAI